MTAIGQPASALIKALALRGRPHRTLTPLNNSSGGKERLRRISKMGDQNLRRLLVTGMTSLVRRNKHHPDSADPRINALLARKPLRLVTVAMANHAARAIWAIMVRVDVYRMPALASATA